MYNVKCHYGMACIAGTPQNTSPAENTKERYGALAKGVGGRKVEGNRVVVWPAEYGISVTRFGG